MTPSLYDLLDVEPDAGSDEIRTAWKAAIADLDPTDRRFRAYNDAAGILLDADKRAEYDAELAEAAAEDVPDAADAAAEPVAEEPDTAVVPDEGVTPIEESTAPSRFSAAPKRWVVLVVAVLATVAVGLAAWSATWESTFEDQPKDLASLSEDRKDSLEAAESIAARVLSYDHRQMDDAELAEKQALMTPAYADEWAKVQRELREEAQAQEAIVTATVRGSAMREISPDGRQAQVVIFADQLVEKAGGASVNLRQMATLRLTRDDDQWLLEKICTNVPEC